MMQHCNYNLTKDIYKDQKQPVNSKEWEKHKRSTEKCSKYTHKYKIKNNDITGFKPWVTINFTLMILKPQQKGKIANLILVSWSTYSIFHNQKKGRSIFLKRHIVIKIMNIMQVRRIRTSRRNILHIINKDVKIYSKILIFITLCHIMTKILWRSSELLLRKLILSNSKTNNKK